MPPPPGTFYYEGSVTVGVWAQKAGTWQKVADQVIAIYDPGPYSQGFGRNFTWSWDGTYQMGTGVQAIGLTIENYSGSAAALSAFSHALFQAQASAGGDRSATPSGQKSIVTVRP